jgi:hypothetical protein
MGNIARRGLRWTLWVCASLGAVVVANKLNDKLLPLLRWSFLRLLIGMRRRRSDVWGAKSPSHALAWTFMSDVDRP